MTLLSAKPRFERNGLTVPYIAAWEPEVSRLPALTVRDYGQGPFLAYGNEQAHDRDQNGVLWLRLSLARGSGKALFEQVHSRRQRRSMHALLCQVCGGSTLEEDFDRQLYVMNSAKGALIQEGEVTAAPPICTECAREAVASCPRLFNRYVAAYAERSRPWGVYGILHDPRTLLPVSPTPQIVPFGDPCIRWVVARRSMSSLHGITAVDLAAVTAGA